MRHLSRTVTAIVLIVIVCGGAVLADTASKPKVDKVTFAGNRTFSDSRLQGFMLTRPSRFLESKRFHREIFEDDLETLITFYEQNGFLQASIVDTSVQLDSLHNTVDVAITLDEGPRTFIEGVTLFGNDFFADSVLAPYIGIKEGDPLRRPVIEDAVVALLSLYAENGFLDASVNPSVQVNDSTHLALVGFSLDEGVRSRVGKIEISGAKRTRHSVILRELSFKIGDTIKYSELINSQRRLYLTGLFESAFIRPLPPQSARDVERTIMIEVTEKRTSEFAISVGYGTVERARGRIELNTASLAGTARKLGTAIEANFIKQGISASFSEPWTLGTRWKTDLSLFGQLRQEPGYHAEGVGGQLTVGRKLGMHSNLSLTYRMENTKLSRIDVTVPVSEKKPRIRSLMLTFTRDTRDNLFDPSSGSYLGWTGEIAGSFLNGSDTFAKSVLTLKRFQSLSRNTVAASALEVGWMDTYGENDEIPLSERFYTGGPTSLRGFGYQMVGPIDDNHEPVGGRFKLVCHLLELRRALYKIVGGVVFFEFGNVWSTTKEISLSDLRADVGTGLRINSPLGILRLDYGLNVDRRPGEPSTRLFFSMGQAF